MSSIRSAPPGHAKDLILRIFSPKINSKFELPGARCPQSGPTIYGNLSVAAALQTDDLLATMKGGWSMNAVRYWAVFSLGVAAGAAAALIYAPQTGEKTRKQLKRHLEDASDYIQDRSGDLSKHATKVYKQTKGRAGDVASKVSSVASNVSSVASNIADKVGDMV
jgi:gas vesicle protein